MAGKRARRSLATFAALAMALTACQTPPGPVTETPPVPPPVAAPPPPSAPVPMPSAARWDGDYAGQGFLTSAPGGQIHCPQQVPVRGLTVRDGRARFGEYRGRVGADGRARLVLRRNWITGRFEDGRFEGTLFRPYPGCRYRLVLERVGSPG